MKRKGMLAAALAAACVLAGRASAGEVGLRVTGALAYVAYGDYNGFVDDVNARMAAETLASGEVSSMHWMPSLAAEALYSFTPALTAGIGAGFLRGSAAFDIVVGGESLSFEHTVTSYPLTGTIYATIPAPLGRVAPYVFGGGGAYYTKLTFDERTEPEASYEAELGAWGFGLHGGAGVAIAIAPRLSAEIAVSGRYAKVRGFTGTGTSGEGTEEDVVLAVSKDGGPAKYGPAPAPLAGSFDEGSVDLSGFTLLVAVRVRL